MYIYVCNLSRSLSYQTQSKVLQVTHPPLPQKNPTLIQHDLPSSILLTIS